MGIKKEIEGEKTQQEMAGGTCRWGTKDKIGMCMGQNNEGRDDSEQVPSKFSDQFVPYEWCRMPLKDLSQETFEGTFLRDPTYLYYSKQRCIKNKPQILHHFSTANAKLCSQTLKL